MVPMFMSGPWMIKAVQDFEVQEGIEGKWATKVMPMGPVNNESSIGGSNLAVWHNSDKVEQATDFIKYMIEPENLLIYNETTGSLPALVEGWDMEPIASNEYLVAIKEQLQTAEPMPLIVEWTEISEMWVRYFEQIILGGADIQQTMDAFNAEAASVLGVG